MLTNAAIPLETRRILLALERSDSGWVLLDQDMCALDVSSGVTRLTGYPREELLGQRPIPDILSAPGHNISPFVREAVFNRGTFSGEVQIRHNDGHYVWLAVTVNYVYPPPGHVDVALRPHDPELAADAIEHPGLKIAVLTDISFTKRFESLQRQMLEDVLSERPLPQMMLRICQALESVLPGVYVSITQLMPDGSVNPLAAPNLPVHILELVRNMRPATGSSISATVAQTRRELITADIASDPRWRIFAPAMLEAGLRASWITPIIDNLGTVMGTFALYFDTVREPGTFHRQVVNACIHLCRIAMERESAQNRIRELAFYDSLTHLPNRAMFHQRAQQMVDAMGGRGHALMFIVDLDRFKQVNESLGQKMGDALLREVARRLQRCVKSNDIVGRLSSDEFAMLVQDLQEPDMEDFAQRILKAIAQPFELDGSVAFPNACVGVCSYPQDGDDVDTLLSHADQAMNIAKQDGHHLWQRYVPEMSKRARERARLEAALRETLENGFIGLSLHYQPQVRSAAPHVVCGLEALMRWQHPELGFVRPDQFIPVAEETGQIHTLTSWLLDEACLQIVRWRKAGVQVPHVAINVSTKSFHNPAFPQQVAQALTRNGLTPQDLLLEITESAVMDANPLAMSNLSLLHKQGMHLSLDDFGTGYSSLSYLNRLPIAELKLDKSFVRDLPNSPSASALMRSVLNIGDGLRIPVVAEGVENEEQVRWLHQHGCPILQGYHFSRPLPADALAQWLSTREVQPTQPDLPM